MYKSTGKYVQTVDGARIYYEVERIGDKCIVFLHGMGGALSAWKREREFFHKLGLSTIAVDLRGHGHSSRSDDESFYDFGKFAADVLRVMKVEGFKKYVVVGHCFGGMIAMTLEGMFPGSCDLLVLVDTSHKPPRLLRRIPKAKYFRKLLGLLAKFSTDARIHGHEDFEKFIGTSDYDLIRIASDILHTSLRSYLLMWEKVMGYDASDLLNNIKVPTLIVDGEDDSIFPPRAAEELKERIKHSELDLIPAANHILIINNPEDLNEIIKKFLVKEDFIK